MKKYFLFLCAFILSITGIQDAYALTISVHTPDVTNCEKQQPTTDLDYLIPHLSTKRSFHTMWEKMRRKQWAGKIAAAVASTGIFLLLALNIKNKIQDSSTKDSFLVFGPIMAKDGNKEATVVQLEVENQRGNTCGGNATIDSEKVKNVLLDPSNPKVYEELHQLDEEERSIIYDKDGALRSTMRQRYGGLNDENISNAAKFYDNEQIEREKDKLRNGQSSSFVKAKTIRRVEAHSVNCNELDAVEWQKVQDHIKKHPGTTIEQASIAVDCFFVDYDKMIPYAALPEEHQAEIRAYSKKKQEKKLYDNPHALRDIDQDPEGIELTKDCIVTAINIFKDHGKIDPEAQIKIYSNITTEPFSAAAIQEAKQNGIHQMVLMTTPSTSQNKGGANISGLGHWTSLVIKRNDNKVTYAISDSSGNPSHANRSYLINLLEHYESPAIAAAYKKALENNEPTFWYKATHLL